MMASRRSLSPEGRREFVECGYTIVQSFITEVEAAELRRAAMEIADAGSGMVRDAALNGVKYVVQSASGRMGEPAVAAGVFRKIMFPHKASPALARFRSSPTLRDAVTHFDVREPECVLDQLNLKVARIGTGFPWHQDAHFLPPLRQAAIANWGGVNLVIALDDADESNGAFEVLEGTHRSGAATFDYDTSTTNADVFDESRRKLIPMNPGDAVFFHPYLAHGSGVNHSDRDRCFLTYWFVSGQAPDDAPGR